MSRRRPEKTFVATGRMTTDAPAARRWNGDGPIILAETGGPTDIGDSMSVTCVCGGTVGIDPAVRSVPLNRFEGPLLETFGLTENEWGWRGHLGLDGLAHVIEHRNHTVAAITSFGELQPGRDIWTHHGVIEVIEVEAPETGGAMWDRAIAIAAVSAVVAGFLWLNVAAVGGYLTSNDLERSGTRVTAEVVGLRESTGPRQADVFTVMYRYADASGQTHTAEASVDENRYLLASLSGTVDIAYDPAEPATSAVVDNDQPVVRLSMAIVVDLIALAMVVAGLRKVVQAGD